MEKFNLGIGTIEFTDAECANHDIYEMFIELWSEYEESFLEEASQLIQLKNKDESLMRLNLLAKRIMKECVSEGIIQNLIRHNIYTYDFDDIDEEYDLFASWNEYFGELKNDYESIQEANEKAHQYREYRKQSRGKWQGGGFGVTGALTGAAKAGIMNGMTGVAHSIGNSIGNAYSDYKANQQIQGLFIPRVVINLESALEEDIIDLSDILIEILNEHGEHIKIYSDDEINKSTSIYNNYNSISDLKNKQEALLLALKYDPYDSDLYELYMQDFYRSSNEDKEFERMCDYFMQDLDEIKRSYLLEEISRLETIKLKDDIKTDGEDEEALIELLEAYLEKKKSLNIDEQYIIEDENTAINIYDLAPDIEHAISINKEDKKSSQNNQTLENFSIGEETGAMELQDMLQNFRFLLKNDECIEIASVTEALDLLRERIEVKKAYKQCVIGDRNSVLATISSIQQFKNKKVGKKILEFLQCIAMLDDAVFNYYIEHENFETNMEKFVGGKFKYNPMITYDLEKGAIFKKEEFSKIYYTEDISERKEIVSQIYEIKSMYEDMDFHNENLLKSLKSKMEVIYDKTQLGADALREINKRLNFIDLRERTVLGVEYSTREEALKERKKVVGNKKYDTQEQADIAQKEVDSIDQFISKNQKSANLIHYTEMFQKLVKEKFYTQAGIDKIEEIEKDIIQKYNALCEEITI